MPMTTFTAIHVLLSLIGIGSGLVLVYGLIAASASRRRNRTLFQLLRAGGAGLLEDSPAARVGAYWIRIAVYSCTGPCAGFLPDHWNLGHQRIPARRA